ncbi:hypothetical protein LTR72_009161 [Exophiala xenobiotica]|nr:hypothetical protein LTR72_009161 [Exophiala xenobiotica]KAK5288679.1 hypothetical protein LTR14_008029 [Exophiala xenobiotica]KAK5390150.1 hypothetical protein LTS13_000231 [Exophiala xenobiotica]KAK5403368.1 hypothetical protein LTR79_000121 [Exophiala xenobiotica]KAK5422856.1 hypothetical protein LTR90_001874 [Exophiala xenobiotica]
MVKFHVASMGNQTPQQTAGSQSLRVKGLSELIGIVTRLQNKIDVLERQQQESTSGATTEPHHDNLFVQDVAGPEQNNQSTTQAASPVFAGPTSADFSFRVADIILQRECGTGAGRSWVNADLAASVSDDEDGDNPEPLQPTAISSSLHGLQLQDVLRLIQVYHESIDILHPLVNTESLQRLASTLFPNDGHAAAPEATALSAGVDIAHLKMAVAIALLAEGGGYSPVARKIHNNLIPIITNHILGRTFTLGGQILLLLTAFYYLFQDDSRLASRYVVIASRIMVEAGLHLKEIRRRYFPCDSEYARVLVVLFTCMYLDRQLNFNAGLPLSLKDTDIDIPEMETMPPYLKAMTSYMRMGPRAWAAVTDERGQLKGRINNEDYEFISFQVRRWEENLPTELRVRRDSPLADQIDPQASLNPGTLLLRFVLYLRANQFKIVIMRPLLFSTQTFSTNIEQVKHVAQLANDSIEMIVTADKRCGLYAKQQPLFNLFLSSALSTLLLIYVHSSPGRGTLTRSDHLPETDMAVQQGIERGLKLLRSYSLSRSSQRLSKKIASLLQRLGFSLSGTDSPAGVGGAHSDPSMEYCHSVINSERLPPFEVFPSQDLSAWNYSNFPPYDGLTSGNTFQYPVSNNQNLSSLALPEMTRMPFCQSTNQFNSDVLLSFMNDFSA